ncbi:hypothetical protein BJY04DRAFT_184579 [Aspergillus karnatakaensis]|uniref:uncharacterized protein n=1 Tax=Aspergillus karnatakaensis TaxID=1810916 RepID=UPI003CCDF325
MPSGRPHKPLNATVEDISDDTEPQPEDPGSNLRLSWQEICTKHENILSSHLKMLEALKDQLGPDAEASSLITTMLERTNKLALQFDGVKSRILPRVNKTSDSTRTASAEFGQTRSDEGMVRPKRRKRQRISNEGEVEREREIEAREPLLAEAQRMKRKRFDVAIPGRNEDVLDAIPVAMETEDISDEVQRRLKIKDEQRRKRDAKPEKRKRDRDSLASNASSSSLGASKPRKKFKLSEQVNR